MKHLTLLSFLLFMISPIINSQQKIMTLNIRLDTSSDGEDRWDQRKEELCQLLVEYGADFIGLQESLPNQVEFIDEKLIDFAYIGFGRDGKGTNSESVPIFYNTAKHELLEMEVFWLSETPGQPSKGWDAALNRITTYGVFKNKNTPDTLYVFNTHFDHRGPTSRINAARLILKKIEDLRLSDKKVILMGDLNSSPDQEPVKVLKSKLKDSFENSSNPPQGPVGTFNSFDTSIIPDERIDYIFTLNSKVLSYRNLNDKRSNGRCISDHLPVLVEIKE